MMTQKEKDNLGIMTGGSILVYVLEYNPRQKCFHYNFLRTIGTFRHQPNSFGWVTLFECYFDQCDEGTILALLVKDYCQDLNDPEQIRQAGKAAKRSLDRVRKRDNKLPPQ